MKVFVIGANGQVGSQVIERLAQNECEVVGAYRDPETQAPEKTSRFTPIAFDLTDSVEAMAEKMAGSDAVIFAAGSRGQNLLKVDLNGAVRAIKAAEKVEVKRYIQLSALHADEPEKQTESLRDYFIAKYYADEWLRNNASLDYVILAPTTLTNDEATGMISLNPPQHSTITRADVATVLIELIESDHHQETIRIANGNLPIAQALG